MKYIVLLLLGFISGELFCQQDPYFSNVRMNQYFTNPAFVGNSDEHNSVNFIHRSQWVGIDNAPETQMISANVFVPHKRIGLGLNIIRDSAPPYNSMSLSTDFAYTIDLDVFKIALGLRGNYNKVTVPLTTLAIDESNDFVFTGDDINKDIFNFGTGAYIYSNNLFLTISIPKLLKTILLEEGEVTGDISGNDYQWIVGGGYKFTLNQDLEIIPSVYYRNNLNLPSSVDLFFRAIYLEKYEITPFFKHDQSRGVQLSSVIGKLQYNYSYEYSTTRIRRYNSGTHEVSIGYLLGKIRDSSKKQDDF